MKKFFLTLAIAAMGFAASAQDDLPQIKMYYPGENPESPMELKPTMKAYTYFTNGAKVIYNKARIIQNGELIGTCVYDGSATGVATTTMKQDDARNAAMADIKPGQFTLEMYEVSYLVDGVEKLYSDASNPIGSVTYCRKDANGKIVSESGVENNTVKSYYPADKPEGLLTVTFDKAVIKDNISAYYEYGGNNIYITTSLPWSLSDDGLTLSVDLRGKSYSPDVLAPGVTFRDDNGNPTDPPTTIALIVTGLNCKDGTKIQTESVSLDGNTRLTIEGRMHKVYHYQNLSFATPALTKIEFYAAGNAVEKFTSINEDTDMFELTVENAIVIASADIKLTVGSVSVVIPASDIQTIGELYTAAIPSEIKAAGSENLVISLENVTYRRDDGGNHVIKPLSLIGSAREIASVAALKELEAGTPVVLNIPEGLKITLSNEQGYIFGEDSTGGIMLQTEDYTNIFDQGKLLTGRLVGTWLGYGLFIVDANASNFTATTADVSLGVRVNSLDELMNGGYENMLVTICDGADTKIEADDYIIIGGIVPVITDFVEGFEIPEELNNITGIYYFDPNANQAYIIIRGFSDVNKNISTGIDSVTSDNSDNSVYNLSGVRLTDTENLPRGIYISKGKKILIND